MVLLLPACLRTEEFPPEPRITFKAFNLVGDSASIVITFTDGDGDVGLNPGDTFPPYAPCATVHGRRSPSPSRWSTVYPT